MVRSSSSSTEFDWLSHLQGWKHAHGSPVLSGLIKAQVEDFRVSEQLDFEPTGAGEHVWLHIRKQKQNTAQVAKQLAKFCQLPFSAVSYSGLKDYFAVTDQWFSVSIAPNKTPDWCDFSMEGVEILKSDRHSRKLQRGTHKANHFDILIRDLQALSSNDNLDQRIESIRKYGVPNYFGPQRFGRDANNMPKALAMLAGTKKIKDRNLRGLLLSSARSWIFNEILSTRIESGKWLSLFSGEPTNLEGTASVFSATGCDLLTDSGNESELARVRKMDIHPTAPLWGQTKPQIFENFRELHAFETEIVDKYPLLKTGLIDARIVYQRRAIRMPIQNLSVQSENDCMRLRFSLNKGQFATSLLRELICENSAN